MKPNWCVLTWCLNQNILMTPEHKTQLSLLLQEQTLENHLPPPSCLLPPSCPPYCPPASGHCPSLPSSDSTRHWGAAVEACCRGNVQLCSDVRTSHLFNAICDIFYSGHIRLQPSAAPDSNHVAAKSPVPVFFFFFFKELWGGLCYL